VPLALSDGALVFLLTAAVPLVARGADGVRRRVPPARGVAQLSGQEVKRLLV